MQKSEIPIFEELMRQILKKGLGKTLQKISQGESQDLAFIIHDALGATIIGDRSLKNYIRYLIDQKFDKINPNLHTLNGLVQYLYESSHSEGLWHNFVSEFKSKNSIASVSIQPVSKKSPLLLFLPLFFLLLFFLSLANFRSGSVLPFQYQFKHSNLDSLQKDSWYLFPEHIDLDQWDKQKYKGNGFLTMETFLGDSWLSNPDYDPEVLNIITKNINCGNCCRIRLKVTDFNPYQRYQQAGFFLFYHKNKAVPSLRYSISNAGDYNEIVAVKRNGKYNNENLLQGRPEINRWSKVENQEVLSPMDSIVLECVIKEDQYFFRFKIDRSDFQTIDSEHLDFGRPRSIGIAAFQGRPDVPSPIREVADIIPAKFEYIEVIPLDCN